MLTRKRSESERRTGAYFFGFGPYSVLMVVEDYDSRLGSNGKEVSVLLRREHAHCEDGAWGSFLAEGSIFTQGDLLVGAHALDGVSFSVVAVEPDFTIRVVIGQSLEEGRGAIALEVDCAHNVSDRVSGVP